MFVNKVNSTASYYSNVAATRYTNAATAVRSVPQSEAFTPSKEAQTFSAMLNKLKGASEVRQDKVSEFQQKISSGQYFVPAENIALSLMTNRY